jgi:CubicO group peptidase (beta-lactamase class C family)
MKTSFLLVAILLMLRPATVLAHQSDSTDARVDEYIKQQMSKYQIPGLTVGVVKNGRLVKAKGFGLASVEFDIFANENTIFQLFSVSKLFAGVAVLKLVEDDFFVGYGAEGR